MTPIHHLQNRFNEISLGWYGMKVTEMLKENNDEERLLELLEHFNHYTQGSKRSKISDFYRWYKDFGLSRKDALAFSVYCNAVREHVNVSMIRIDAFADKGEWICQELIKWRGSAGNTLKSLLELYFEVNIKEALNFNKGILVNPKSFLGSWGWGNFETHIHKEGGKHSILTASKKDLAEAEDNRKMLNRLDEVKRDAREKGNLKLYDDIGKLLSRVGIKETYDAIFSK